MRRRAAPVAACVLAAGLALGPAAPVPARAVEPAPPLLLRIERPESEILLLALAVDRTVLVEALTAYSDQGRVLVPFGEVCRLLGLGITVDVTRGLATGFFLREDRTFRLDPAARKVVVEGREKRYDPAGIELHADDLYIDAALFAAWLPIRLDIDLYTSSITVRADEKLPIQLRLERAAQLERSGIGQTSAVPSLPRLPSPYDLWDGPFVDQTVRFDRRQGANLEGGSQLFYSTYLTGDLLKMEASAYVAGSDRGFSDSRFSLGRKDPDGRLLGALHAREVTIGDVFHPGLDLIALPRSGPGFLLSNFPLQRPTQFDRQSFRGDLPPGWEVELYRGDELLAYAQARPDGLYEFLDIPLTFGLNVFRLELYGPQGQKRREFRRLNVGETLTPKGKLQYRLAANDPSTRLLGSGLAEVGRRGSLEISTGLSRHLSASASLAAVDLKERRHIYGLGSLRGYWSWLYADASFATERDGGSAWQGTVQSRLGAFGLLVQHSRLHRFESEALFSTLAGASDAGGNFGVGAIESRTLLRLDTALPEGLLPRIPLLFEIRQDQLADGRRLRRLSGRFSAFRRGFFVSNQVTWNRFSSPASDASGLAPASTDSFGHLLVSRYVQSGALRGEVDYDLDGGGSVRSALLTAERTLGRGFLFSAGFNRTFLRAENRYLLGVSRIEGTLGFSVTADYTRAAGFGLGVLVAQSVGRDPRTGTWHPQARALAGTGGLSGLAFLDTDGNGRRDAGEPAIPGAGFLLNGGGSLARTDESGLAFVANLPPYQPLDVALSPATLEDPYWKPAQAGVRIVPRPGKVARLDFPVEVAGEITGTLFLRRGSVSRFAGNVGIELADSRGTVVQRGRSAYDGFYDLAEVKPGRYRLRVASDEAARLRLASVPSREVEVAPSGTIVEGFNLYLTGEEERAAVAAGPAYAVEAQRPPG